MAVASFEDQAVLVSPSGRVLGVKDGGERRRRRAPRTRRRPRWAPACPPPPRAPLRFLAAAAARGGGPRAGAAPDRPRDWWRAASPAGRSCCWGGPERMDAKAQALGLLLASLSAEEEATASYIDLTVPENPALGTGLVTLMCESRLRGREW